MVLTGIKITRAIETRLRDEFMFRCVYCLHREQWYNRGATFNIDHFVPAAVDPHSALAYANLLYACASCNSAKCDLVGIPDPCKIAFAECLKITDRARVEALNDAGKALIEKLRLNNAKNVETRSRFMRTFVTLLANNPGLYREFMAFPDDLPDLRVKKAPTNSIIGSENSCYCAMRERGELPATY